MFTASAADAGDFLNGRVAWDILNQTAVHETYIPPKIDLSHCNHLKPYSVACLAALGARGNREIPLVLPESLQCREHLGRLGLYGWFQPELPPEVEIRDTNVPVQQLLTRPGNFAGRVMGIWAREMGGTFAVNQQRTFSDHLDEMILNALGHSESPVGCFVAGQQDDDPQADCGPWNGLPEVP